MSKVNLALATAGDVAVLRNETRYKIMHKERSDLSPYFPVRILFEGINVHATYSDNGNFCRNIQSPADILDVLRNGASIFEQSKSINLMADQEKQSIIEALNFAIKDCLCQAERTDPNYHEHEYSCTQNEDGTILFKDFVPYQQEPTTLVTGSAQGLVDALNTNYPTLLNYALNRLK